MSLSLSGRTAPPAAEPMTPATMAEPPAGSRLVSLQLILTLATKLPFWPMALVVLVVDAVLGANAFSRGVDTSFALIDQLNAVGLIAGPLLAGTAAWLAWRDRTLLQSVIAANPRRLRRAGPVVLATLLVEVGGAHLLATGVAAVLARVRGLPGDPGLLSTVAAVGGLAVALSIGYLLGCVIRSAVAAPVAAVLLFVLPWLSAMGLTGRWLPGVVLVQGGSGTSMDGLAPRLAVVLAMAAVGFGLMAVVAGTGPGRRRFQVTSPRLVVAGVVPLLVGWALLAGQPGVSMYSADTAPSPVTCVNGATTVCVRQINGAVLTQVTAAVAGLRSELKRLGVTYPVTEVHDASPVQYESQALSATASQRVMLLGAGSGPATQPITSVKAADIITELMLPSACRVGNEFLAIGSQAAAQATLGWLASAADGTPAARSGMDGTAQLAAASPAVRDRVLTANVVALLVCDSAALVALP